MGTNLKKRGWGFIHRVHMLFKKFERVVRGLLVMTLIQSDRSVVYL